MTEAIEAVQPRLIEPGRIDYSQYQPRLYPVQEQDDWDDFLKTIIAAGGNYEPIHVIDKDGQWICFIGHRRGLGCEEAGLPVLVIFHHDLSEEEIWARAIGSNTARKQMTRAEIILSIKKLVEEFNLSISKIEEKLNLSHKVAQHYFNCITLIQPVLEKIDSSELPFLSAVEIAKLDQNIQEDFTRFGINMDWTVDQFKEYVPIYQELTNKQRKQVLTEKIGIQELKGFLEWKKIKNEMLDELLNSEKIYQKDHDFLTTMLIKYEFPESTKLYEMFRKKIADAIQQAMHDKKEKEERKQELEEKRAILLSAIDLSIEAYSEYPEEVSWFQAKRENAVNHTELERIETLIKVVNTRIADADKTIAEHQENNNELAEPKSRLEVVNEVVKQAAEKVQCQKCKQDYPRDGMQEIQLGSKPKPTCEGCVNQINFELNLHSGFTKKHFDEVLISAVRAGEFINTEEVIVKFQKFAAENYIVLESLISKLEICCETYSPSLNQDNSVQLLCSDHNKFQVIPSEKLEWQEVPEEYRSIDQNKQDRDQEIVCANCGKTKPLAAKDEDGFELCGGCVSEMVQEVPEIDPSTVPPATSQSETKPSEQTSNVIYVEDPESEKAIEKYNELIATQKIDRTEDLGKFVNRINIELDLINQIKSKLTSIVVEMSKIPELNDAAEAIRVQMIDDIPDFLPLDAEDFDINRAIEQDNEPRPSINDIFPKTGLAPLGLCGDIMQCKAKHTGLKCNLDLLHVQAHEGYCEDCGEKLELENLIDDMKTWYDIQFTKLIDYVKDHQKDHLTRVIQLSEQTAFNENKSSAAEIRQRYNVIRGKFEAIVEEFRKAGS